MQRGDEAEIQSETKRGDPTVEGRAKLVRRLDEEAPEGLEWVTGCEAWEVEFEDGTTGTRVVNDEDLI